MHISARLEGVHSSLTLEMTARAASLKRAGHDVVSLSAGEPDFGPPAAAVEAAHQAIHDDLGKYTPVEGTPEFCEAIGGYLKREMGLSYNADEIVVSSGAKQALFTAIFVLCSPGDEIIIPTPFWASYPEIAQALGVRPVLWETTSNDSFRLHGSTLKKLITPRTKALLLNSPNNPTGAVISQEELSTIAEILAPTDIAVISDDIYEQLVYPGTDFRNIVQIDPSFRDRTVLVNGVSKAFCMTGWRIGYAAGPKDIIDSMKVIQGHMTSCANAIAQIAATAALNGVTRKHLSNMVATYQRRGGLVFDALQAIDGISARPSESSFYSFFTIKDLFGRTSDGKVIQSAIDFCDLMLDQQMVALVPGEAFGNPRGVRLSYATSTERIEEGLRRITAFCDGLEAP